MNTSKSNFLVTVKDQYEDYPYPPRDPESERTVLIKTEADFIGKISHYCFNGRFDPRKGSRMLVAGGGTGDAALYLAEQLRTYDAEIVYLDISTASMDIAKRRAQVRGLDNIAWVNGSILDLPELMLGKFDYINCCGVLHHMENPVKGLLSLKACLQDNGAIGIMVYAKYGRTGVYHMQELMRLINFGVKDAAENIANTRHIIKSLPGTHCLKSGPIPLTDAKASELEDSDLVDLFLHDQDRPYTVAEIYTWLEECGLHLVDFVCNKPLYQPETHLKNTVLLKRVLSQPRKTRQAIAENLDGTIYRHVFYASLKQGTIASFSDNDNIPYLCDMLPLTDAALQQLQQLIASQPEGSKLRLQFPQGKAEIMLPVEQLTKYFFRHINGKNTIQAIVKAVKYENDLVPGKLTNNVIYKDLKRLYELFNSHDAMFLRNKKIPPYKTTAQV